MTGETPDWEHWRKRIFRYFYHARQIRDVQVCNDLTSQVLCKAIEAEARNQGAHTNFEAWMLRIARNVAIDHARRLKLRVTVDIDEVDGFLPALIVDMRLDAIAIRNEQLAVIERLANGLTDMQAQAFRLRYAGYGYDEIAAVMDSTEGNIKGLVRRAEESIRTRLGYLKRLSDTG